MDIKILSKALYEKTFYNIVNSNYSIEYKTNFGNPDLYSIYVYDIREGRNVVIYSYKNAASFNQAFVELLDKIYVFANSFDNMFLFIKKIFDQLLFNKYDISCQYLIYSNSNKEYKISIIISNKSVIAGTASSLKEAFINLLDNFDKLSISTKDTEFYKKLMNSEQKEKLLNLRKEAEYAKAEIENLPEYKKTIIKRTKEAEIAIGYRKKI